VLPANETPLPKHKTVLTWLSQSIWTVIQHKRVNDCFV